MTILPFRKSSIARLACVKCGAETDAACNCGVEYKPAAVRAAEAVAANPGKSDRLIAADLGVSPTTVGKARKSSTVHSGQLAKRIGKDGKARKLPKPIPTKVTRLAEFHKDDDPAEVERKLFLFSATDAVELAESVMADLAKGKITFTVTRSEIQAVRHVVQAWLCVYRELRKRGTRK